MLVASLALVGCCGFWYVAGNAGSRIGAPAITGIILAGALTGPDVLNIMTVDRTRQLLPIEHACLSAIALAAGLELSWEDIASKRKQVISVSLGVILGSWIAVCSTVAAMFAYIGPSKFGLQSVPTVGAACLSGTIALARSPASAMAVIQETQSTGPYCSLVLSVTVLKDIALFLLFALSMDMLSMMGTTQHQLASSWTLAKVAQMAILPLARVLVSASLGYIGATFLGWIRPAAFARWAVVQRLAQRNTVQRMKAVLAAIPALLVASAVFYAAEALDAEPLLGCVTAGVIFRNAEWLETVSSGGEKTPPPLAIAAGRSSIHAGLSTVLPAVSLVFFGLVGTHLEFHSVTALVPLAVLVVLARVFGIVVGCAAGGSVGSVPPSLRGYLWRGMITQAGIALGLIRMIARRFPSWGPAVPAMLAGTVLINLLIGPLLFKSALFALGESVKAGRISHAKDHERQEKGSETEPLGGTMRHIPVIAA